MPILSKKEKFERQRLNEKNILINLVKKITVVYQDKTIHAIDIDLKDGAVKIMHPVYELLSYDQKQLLIKLIKDFGFYIQWQIFPISSQ